jgi:hypothetical protein
VRSREKWNIGHWLHVIVTQACGRKFPDRPFNKNDQANRAKERTMTRLTKTLTVLAAVATIGVAAVAAPQPAQARGGALAAGILGGLAAGAIIGSAVHGPYYYDYGPGYYYGPAPVYYDGPPCYISHRRYWDGWAWHVRRVRVCD